MKISSETLVKNALEKIHSISSGQAEPYLDDDDTLFVDLRDIREVKKTGTIPGALHCPRGMLEFWIDPESPYHKKEFQEKKRFVFYCAIGWRSSLASLTAQEMGLENVLNLEKGMTGWIDQDLPVEKKASS